MSRFRLYPTPEQEKVLLRHCSDARYVWNLCVEQQSWWRRGRGKTPGWAGRCRQLTEARADNPWLAEGSVRVQQQALRDFDHAMQGFFDRTHGHPTWRKAGRDEGFRIVGKRGTTEACHWDTRRLNRNWADVRVPKVGWVRFRWSRAIPAEAKSYRVTLDRAGRWHVAFAVIPEPVSGPGTGEVVGIDRGVAVSAALSTGELLNVPGLSGCEERRLVRLQRKLTKARRGSGRRGKVKVAVAELNAREKGRRKDWCEKTSTSIARRFDVIRVEDLKIRNMIRSAKGTMEQPGKNVRQKAGLNRDIRASGWGLLVRRIEEKAPGRVEKVPPAFTSQRCSACGHVDRESRESQADFRCTACAYTGNADVNAAIKHRRRACGESAGRPPVGAVEPRTSARTAYGVNWNLPLEEAGEDAKATRSQSRRLERGCEPTEGAYSDGYPRRSPRRYAPCLGRIAGGDQQPDHTQQRRPGDQPEPRAPLSVSCQPPHGDDGDGDGHGGARGAGSSAARSKGDRVHVSMLPEAQGMSSVVGLVRVRRLPALRVELLLVGDHELDYARCGSDGPESRGPAGRVACYGLVTGKHGLVGDERRKRCPLPLERGQAA